MRWREIRSESGLRVTYRDEYTLSKRELASVAEDIDGKWRASVSACFATEDEAKAAAAAMLRVCGVEVVDGHE